MVTSWVTVHAPRQAPRLRLICLAAAGASAAAFAGWPERLPEDVELWAVEYPGRGARRSERPFVRVPAMVAALLPELLPALTSPFAVFGHCMGAFVGFELARQLALQRRPTPVALFAAGCRAPHLPPRKPPTFALPDGELIAHLEQLESAPTGVLRDSHFATLFLPPLRADLEAAATYRWRRGSGAVACPVFVYGGRDDLEAPAEDLRAWHECSSSSFTARLYDSNHLFLGTCRDEVLADLAADLVGSRGTAGGDRVA